MRRVVVTGMGAITPVGNDIDTMWANMLAGVNGVEKITSFDTSDLKVHLAGTVKNFEPEKYIEKRELRKLDIYCQYAIAAAQQAVDDSGILVILTRSVSVLHRRRYRRTSLICKQCNCTQRGRPEKGISFLYSDDDR